MATYARANAWNNGGTFDNYDLLWYAKGVGVMQARALDDPTSWWFFAAIHGEYVAGETAFPGWGYLASPPAVPASPAPPQPTQDRYWDQCQHGTWYFLPWHRGYLIALEAQVRAAIIGLGGPSNWALPYWDYLALAQAGMPPAFSATTLPDNSPNPLFVTARYGPGNDGIIVIPQEPSPGEFSPVDYKFLANDVFTGTSLKTSLPGFGGPATGFSHSSPTVGNFEQNPHNLVHVYIGGTAPDGRTDGFMTDPGLAALDPIFYLHHSNIDRLWEYWNIQGNANPTDINWLNGPTNSGPRGFAMPMPNSPPWLFQPAEVNRLAQLDYTYDNFAIPVPAAPTRSRLTRLGVDRVSGAEPVGAQVHSDTPTELMGASQGPLVIRGTEARTSVRLDAEVRQKVSASLASAALTAAPDRVYLSLENVRGTRDAFVLQAYVNDRSVGSVGLFGLRRASRRDGAHAGEGLNFVFEISDVIDALHMANALDVAALDIRLVPHQEIPEQAEVTVGRVSVYRQGS